MEAELAQRFIERKQAIQTTRIAIRSAIGQAAGSIGARTALRELAARDSELFFEAALSILDADPGGEDPSNPSARLCECPEFLIQLTRPERFSYAKLLEMCRRLIRFDPRLDVRLSDLLPKRHEDKYRLNPLALARILEVLNEISVGPRLVLLLTHLTDHPDVKVRAKAIVLMGRRICNSAWPHRHLASSEAGIRASAVEALWGRNTPTARTALWDCVRDAHQQVAGKALFGLHLLGESEVGKLAADMLDDERPPFRSTAAEVMGKIGSADFTAPLMKAATDSDATVRLEAKRALVIIRQPIRQQESLAAAEAREAALNAPPTPPHAPATPNAPPTPPPAETTPPPEETTPPPEETTPPPALEQLAEPVRMPDFNLRLDGRHTSTR